MPPREARPSRRAGGGLAWGTIIGVMIFCVLTLLAARPVYLKFYGNAPIWTDVHPLGGERTGGSPGSSNNVAQPPPSPQWPEKKAASPPPSASPPPPAPPPKPVIAAKAVVKEVVKEVVKSVEPIIKSAATGDEGISALDKEYTPSKEMVAKIAQDGYLMVTWANFHYFDFVKTWVHHVQKVGVTGYIVGAMDDHLLTELIKRKVNCFSMKSGLTLGDFGWGSKTFSKMGREKIRLISVFLKLDVTVIIADVDVVWLRNPIPFFQRFPDADMLTSSDHLTNTVPDESLEIWPHAASAANIGIMMFRAKSMPFVEHWIDVIEKDENIWDQNAFNDLFRVGAKILPASERGLFLGYKETLRMGILPVSIFCSGHTYYIQRLAERLKLDVYAVHNTFQFSGTSGKRNRMREDLTWWDEDEYYDHKTGFVEFAMDGVDELLKNAGPLTGQMDLANVQGHFLLVNHQTTRIRNALAISQMLGRALVMPNLWCGLDRWWAPHAGRIPGSSFPLPFNCPLDHVFDLEGGLFRNNGPAEPPVEYREHSFFKNPRTLPAVRDSRAYVKLCAKGDSACSDGTTAAVVKVEVDGKPTIAVQAGLMSDQLTKALSSVSSYKVIEFSSMAYAFGNYSNPAQWRTFSERIKQSASIWCCVLAHPGHIHYDLWWDIPHTDKFMRQWDKWEPKCGP